MDIAKERLKSQCIVGRPMKGPVDVVRWLVASQAQDFAGAKWALGLRTRSANDAAVEKAFNEGAILRTHMMRPTWHFVAQEDIRWMLALTSPRVHALNAPYYRKAGLDAATLKKATAIMARALEKADLTRDELRLELTRARIDSADLRMPYMLMHAELNAVICSGPRRGKQFTYALFEKRAPRARTLSRDDALVELAVRYFTSRGPATAHDFAKWSGLTIADARRGLEAVAPKLRRAAVGGTSYWSRKSASSPNESARCHLLSIYDEYLSSYRDRSAICEPAHAKRLIGLGNAVGYVVVIDGRIVGTWKRSLSRDAIHVEVTPFRKLNLADKRAVRAAAARFAQFLGGSRALDLKIR